MKAPKVSDELRRILQIGSSDERKTQLESLLPLCGGAFSGGRCGSLGRRSEGASGVAQGRALNHGLARRCGVSLWASAADAISTRTGAAACGWIGRLVKDLSVLVPKTSKIDQTHGLSIVWFAQSRLAKTPDDYDAWRSSLPSRSKARLQPTGSTWLPYALESRPKDQG